MEIDATQIPVPEEEEDDLLFGDTECFLTCTSVGQAWEIFLQVTDVPECDLPSPEQHFTMFLWLRRNESDA